MDGNSQVWQRPELAKLFLEGVRGGIPLAAEQIDVLLRVVRHATSGVGRLLDVGCGDGILARAVMGEYSDAAGLFVDFSSHMIEAAKKKADPRRSTFLVEDLGSSGWTKSVSKHAPFDVVLSGLAIHHLPDARKRELYAEIFDLLAPGGLFLNLEHVAFTSDWERQAFDELFIDSLWGYHQKQGSATTREAVAEQWYHRPDKSENILAPLERQCEWLAEIGFENVDCFFKLLELALFGGQKPKGGPRVIDPAWSLLFPRPWAILRTIMKLDDIIAAGAQPEIVGQRYGFTEGPAADRQGNVYFSDGKNNSIYYWEIGKPPVRFVDDSTDAIGMMFNGRGELYVCEGAAYRIVAYDVHTKAKRVLCDQIDGQHFNEPNDLAIDFHHGFYFSDPNYQHHGQPTVMKQDVYYCSAEGQVSRVSTICYKPNGVLLSADDRTLYVADARGQVIYRYDVTGPGRLAGERLWIDKLGANPDGLTLDEHDNLYICCGKAGLKIYDRAGQPLGRIDVHAANCCFGGRDFRTLCVASADKFLGIRTQVEGLKPLALRV